MCNIQEVLDDTSPDDLVPVVRAACALEKMMYYNPHDTVNIGKKLFDLRKALEGIFGHDIPDPDGLYEGKLNILHRW
jgi:hypothetical protein